MNKEMSRDEYIKHIFKQEQKIQSRIENSEKKNDSSSFLKKIENIFGEIQTRIIKN